MAEPIQMFSVDCATGTAAEVVLDEDEAAPLRALGRTAQGHTAAEQRRLAAARELREVAKGTGELAFVVRNLLAVLGLE
jgi:hypothetical protein